MNGIGWSPVGPVEGTSVIITFADADQQQPIMLGTIGGIPQSKAASVALEDSGNIATDGGVIAAPDGKPVTKADGSVVTLGNRVEAEVNQLTTAVDSEIQNIKNKMAAITAAAFGDKFASLFGKPAGAKLQTKTLPITGADKEGKDIVIPPAPAAKDTSITAQPEPGKADPVVLNTPINLQPPPKEIEKGKEGIAKQSCQEIVNALAKLGITHKYAVAGILGIVGGETKWVPKNEGHRYSNANTLVNSFRAFKGDITEAEKYTSGKVTPEQFFEKIYGHTTPKGQELGNKEPGDGGKYFGRGFNQLTGKSNYTKMQNDLKKYGYTYDILGNPELLNSDITCAAAACAIYYKERMKDTPQDSPRYFFIARERTGKDIQGGYAKKEVFYNYFLGQEISAQPTTRPPVDDATGKVYTKEEVSQLPKEKQDALLEDRSENATIGFRDPKGKYPLRNLLNEPDTNRLARGVIQETAIAYKDQIRTLKIPCALGTSFEQPIAPFGGQYPYNKVYESESGHIMMFDDTTGHETISLTHRKGTFIDIDANGTQVNKIVGDGYTIYDRNGMIYVAGKCNLTVGNSVNILVQGDANIEVNGGTQAIFHGQVDIGATKDVNMAVGGDFNLSVEGNFNTWVSGDKVSVTTGNTAHYVSGGSETAVTGDSINYVGGKHALETAGDLSLKSSGNIKTDAGVMLSLYGKETRLTGSDIVHVKSPGGIVALDGTQLKAQQGAAVETEGFESLERGTAPVTTLASPPTADARDDSFEVLTTPVRPAPEAPIKTELLDQWLESAGTVVIDKDLDAAGVGAVAAKKQPPEDPAAPVGPAQPMAEGDLQAFLQKHYELGKGSYWTERAMTSGKVEDSNPNIVAMWKDIGLYSLIQNPVPDRSSPGLYAAGGDQTAWCMAFCTWVLKQTGHKWVQTASAAAATNMQQKFGFTKVTDNPQNGDVMHIKFNKGGNHVAFVWNVKSNGKFGMLGGNQGGSGSTANNPQGGRVSLSYDGLISMSGYKGFDIIGIYRPSKA
jgi:predicted chitinase